MTTTDRLRDCVDTGDMTVWESLQSNHSARAILMVSVLMLGGAWTWLGRVPNHNGTGTADIAPLPGLLAPDLTLPTLAGETVSLSDLRGKAVVINFWATWCLPCRTEMPALERTWTAFRNEGLVILAVNLQESPERVAAFTQELGLTLPVLLDRDGLAFSKYQVQLYPTTFFVGRDGVIQDVVFGGPMAETLIASKAAQLLEG